jgi:hypothetical protein
LALQWKSPSHSAAKDFVHLLGLDQTGNPMIDDEAPLTLTFGAILRVGIPVSILWIIGDAIDGGSQSFIGVPLLVAAWLGAVVALDRWVGGQRGRPPADCSNNIAGSFSGQSNVPPAFLHVCEAP